MRESDQQESAPEQPRRRPGYKRTDEICDGIMGWIVEDRLKPGDRLPQERELITRFKASKSTVREALKALQTQGLITTRTGPGGGAFVAALDGNRAMELLSNYFYFRQPTIGDIYALRKMLEPEMAASVAGRLNEEDFRRLEDTIKIYDHPAANIGEEYRQRIAELDFHTVLAELCPNPILGFMCSFLQNLLRNLSICRRIYDTPNPNLRESALHYQIRLIDALRKADADGARKIMFEHMCTAQEYMEACEAEIAGGFLRMSDNS